MEVADTELYVVTDKCHVNILTKRPWRLSDGRRHPVRIVQPARGKKERRSS